MHASTGRVLGLLLLPFLLSGQTLAAQPAAMAPVADFFREPVLSEPQLSPDGKRVAMVVVQDGKRGQLAVFDLDRPAEIHAIAGFNKVDITGIRWVNNQRLVYSVADKERALSDSIWPGLWAIDADGSNLRQLAYVDRNADDSTSSGAAARRILPYNTSLHAVLHDGSDDVLVRQYGFDGRDDVTGVGLMRVNTRNGTVRSLVKGAPNHVHYWWADARTGSPVALETSADGKDAIYLAESEGSWKKLIEFDSFAGGTVPLAAGNKGDLWMRGADPQGKSEVDVLLRLDTRDPNAKPQTVLDLKTYSFTGSLIIEGSTGEVLGVRYRSDAPGTHWFNADMKALQAQIDGQLESTVNTFVCSNCLSNENLLIQASSDRQPMVLLAYNKASRKLSVLGSSQPGIKPAQQGEREIFDIKARDGLRLPVLVTFPPGKREAARPAVVLVHGGPYVRNAHWEWEPAAQFLASRGYVVIEPEFRGSTGYGWQHFQAGWKQWGLKMQDDIADAGDWAIKQGFADAKRVCIAGASYGGYATLMGLVRYDDRYQCGIEWAGVTDIDLLYSITWSDADNTYQTYGMPRLIGDRQKDAAQFVATSPLKQADKIRKPLLMAYGGNDRRVPLEHGRAMRDALGAAGYKGLEWVVYPEEGHGWTRLADNVDFWTRVEKFLARHIGDKAGQ